MMGHRRPTISDLSSSRPNIEKRWWKRPPIIAAILVLTLVVCRTLVPRPAYQSARERDFRPYRFPSVKERVQLYMSDWYQACHDHPVVQATRVGSDWHVTDQSRVLAVTSTVNVSTLFYYDQSSLSTCARRRWSVGPYCSDALSTMSMVKDWSVPMLLQFGDEDETRAYTNNGELAADPIVPHVKKFRRALTKQQLQDRLATCQSPSHPIVWKLNVKRHYRDLYLVPRYDRSWHRKLNQAVFRGALTGSDTETSDCLTWPRCRLVYQSARSTLIDAKLTKLLDNVPDEINGVNLVGPMLSMRQLLRYKGIIILQGNDVSSGLKWALLSQSVVLMPPPTWTSWAMEERLEPWMHYIPLDPDLANVEAQVQWMLDHPSESQRIAHRASLWIKDLVFHPQAAEDEAEINREILRRYRQHFVA